MSLLFDVCLQSHVHLAIDNRLTATWAFTEKIAGEQLAVTVNGQFAPLDGAFKVGLGFQMNL